MQVLQSMRGRRTMITAYGLLIVIYSITAYALLLQLRPAGGTASGYHTPGRACPQPERAHSRARGFIQ
jgi:hypothetical protein